MKSPSEELQFIQIGLAPRTVRVAFASQSPETRAPSPKVISSVSCHVCHAQRSEVSQRPAVEVSCCSVSMPPALDVPSLQRWR